MRSAVLFFVWLAAMSLAGCSTGPVQRYDPAPGADDQSLRVPALRYGVTDPQFERDLMGHLGSPVTEGNRVDTFVNGDEIFPAMLQAIRSARSSISFETFVYWAGDIGRTFAVALADRARDGVQVRVLLDWFGSVPMESSLIEMMMQAGVKVQRYHPPNLLQLSKLNNRTHQKLLVIDGRIGFTGGVGIAPEWTGNAQDPNHWHDTHYRVLGPAVAQMQAGFLDNWAIEGDEPLVGERYFPAARPWGNVRAQMFYSAGSSGGRRVKMLYLLAIAAARRSVDIESAYFVPDADAVAALVDARRRGVRIRVVVPGPYLDKATLRAASRATWQPLLEAGVELHEFQPTMLHAKLMVVDGYFASVGSANFDNRSFRINDEANLNVFDAAFARQQQRLFEDALGKSKQVTLEQWQQRPLTERIMEEAAGLFRSQM